MVYTWLEGTWRGRVYVHFTNWQGGKHLNIASLIIYLWWRSAEAFGEEPAQTSRAHFITVAGNAWEIALLSCFRCMGNCTFFLCSCFICSLISPTHIHIRAYYVILVFTVMTPLNGSVVLSLIVVLLSQLSAVIYKLREWPLTSYMRLVIHLKKTPHDSAQWSSLCLHSSGTKTNSSIDLKYCRPLSTKRCICLQRKQAMGFEYLILFTYLPKAPAVLRYLPFVTQTPWKQVQFCRFQLFESSEIQHADAQSRKCFFANI